MTRHDRLSRRAFLARTGAIGCSLAASPLMTPIALAAAPGDNRLVVIILRGAMDGLDVVRPIGAPEYAAMRPSLASGKPALALDDFFGLHPSLGGLYGLWGAGELAFAHAVSTPYRDKRSHFDGQDILETGSGRTPDLQDGWLNRALGLMQGTSLRTGFAVGREDLLVLSGDAEVSEWAPDTVLTLTPQSRLLLNRMYRDTPLFRASMTEAIALAGSLAPEGLELEPDTPQDAMMATLKNMRRKGGTEKIARFTAEQLRGETRIASFSINGWDTHAGQKRGLAKALGELEKAILTLKAELAAIWGKTTVIAMTEFGRTARENGTGGTDHGTGGALVLAGGAVAGGKVYGDWPGLGELDLYQGRDLAPTADIRAYAATALMALYGLSRSEVELQVFPGLTTGSTPNFLR